MKPKKKKKNSESATQFLADFFRHRTTQVVKRDRNGNAIVVLISKRPCSVTEYFMSWT